jgi:general stress protein YciG
MSTKGRGFASMDPEKQREIARKGGRAAHEKGTAHEWNSLEARVAGRLGGIASHGGGRPKMDEARYQAQTNQVNQVIGEE